MPLTSLSQDVPYFSLEWYELVNFFYFYKCVYIKLWYVSDLLDKWVNIIRLFLRLYIAAVHEDCYKLLELLYRCVDYNQYGMHLVEGITTTGKLRALHFNIILLQYL